MEKDKRSSNPRSNQALPLAVRLLRTIQLGAPISPRLAGRWAEWLWLRPGRYPEPRQEGNWRKTARQIAVEHRGQSLSVHTWGTGPVVLLVHGWNGRGTQLGAFMPGLVAAGFQVVTFDTPAHGRSPGNKTNIIDVSNAIQSVTRVCGVPIAVIAHSFGVACSLYAVRQGLKVGRIVAIAPPAHMRELVQRFFSFLNLPPAAQVSFIGRMEKSFGADMWDRFSPVSMATQIEQPGLVIHDEDDNDVPLRDGEAVARAWPGAEFMRTTRLGHRRILRDPAVIARVIEFVIAGKSP